MDFKWKESLNTWKEDWSEHPPSQDERRIIEHLKKTSPHTGKTLLHIGIGSSTLASELSWYDKFDRIDGITVLQSEIDKANSLKIKNYNVYLCNKHTIFFLDLPKYDLIVDNGILTFSDCEICAFNLFHSFLRLLNPDGLVLTDSFGMYFAKKNTPSTFRKLIEKFGVDLEVVEYNDTVPHCVTGLRAKK